jgi:hypothetical protein
VRSAAPDASVEGPCRGDIDAVYIALPNDMHKEWMLRTGSQSSHATSENTQKRVPMFNPWIDNMSESAGSARND